MAASRELFPLPELPSTMVNFPRRNPTSEIMLQWKKIFFLRKTFVRICGEICLR
jgi:hypothetical protein